MANFEKAIRLCVQKIKDFFGEKFRRGNEDFPYYFTMLLSLIFFIIGLNLFVELTDELLEQDLEPFDQYFTQLIYSFRSDGMTNFMRLITDLGDRDAYIVQIIIIGLFFFFRYNNWKLTLQTVSVLVLATLVNIVLKRVFERQRPLGEHLVEVSTLSYPSGHSMSAMAFYGFLIYLAIRYGNGRWQKLVPPVVFGAIILLIGISRVYLGVHFPSDVIAGFLGGIIWVTLSVIIFNIISLMRLRNKRMKE